MTRAFFDTNILVYAYADGDPRMATARQLLHEGGTVSVQCLNEFANVALRKLAMPWPDIHDAIDIICSLCDPIVPIGTEVHAIGLRIAENGRLSIYDAMIVAAARVAECDVLFSEDMQHGLVVDAVLTITNPFRE